MNINKKQTINSIKRPPKEACNTLYAKKTKHKLKIISKIKFQTIYLEVYNLLYKFSLTLHNHKKE